MENKFLKRLFSMCIVIALVLSMCPTVVFAEGETAETEVDTTNPNYCPHCKTVLSDAAWTDLGKYVADSGNKLPAGHYRLYNDYTLTGDPLWFNTSATVVIDLAGHTLAPSEGKRPITVDSGRTLYLLNSAGDTDADGNVTGKVQGGSLESSSASTYGGAIYINGTLYMYGGTVTGGSIETTKASSGARYAYGGNIYINTSGTMVMYGGTVTGGSVHTIHTYNKTTATESYSGSPAYGGNIYAAGSLTVEGGTISGGTATAVANCPENKYCARGDFRGGNIYNVKDGLTINGGTITGGEGLRGGNIYSTKNMTINDGLITLGTADRGGNIAISGSAKLSIYGGTISEGYMTWGGGNIFATDQTAAVYVYGGNITNTLKCGGSNGALIGTMYSNLFVFGGYFENTSTTYSMYTSSTGSSKLSKVEIYGGTFVQSTNWTGNASYTSVDVYNAIFIGKDAKFSQTAACATRTVTTAADGRDMYVYSQTLDADNRCATCGITYSAEACSHALTNQPGTALGTVSAVHPAIYFAPCEHCSPSADVAWVPMTDNHVVATHYYLPADLQLESPVKVASNKTVCIDLNGKTITAPEGQRSFDVAGTLTIMDSQFNASIDENGELTGTAGKIVGSTVIGDYGNIKVAGGSADALATLNLLGGVIMNGDANFKDGGNDASAGNIMIGNAVVNINGGIVCGGSAEKYGGNIYVSVNGELNIDGGTIHGGHSDNLGGNVFATSGGVINMYSGTVSGGTTKTRGGNICLNTHGKFNMYGGTLKDGVADVAGANLAVCEGTATSDYATAKIFGGTISGGELLHYSRTCTLEIYNVTMDTDPSKSGYNGASAVADCADYCKVGDVYKVWHTGDDHAEEMALVADADKNSDVHDWADATCLVKSTCKNCGQTTGNFAEHIFDEETGACKYGCGTTACSGGHAAGEAKQEDVVNATCKEDGSYNLVTRCTRCDAIVTSEAKVIEKLPHVYDAETGICKNGCEKTYCENNNHTAGEAMQEELVPATCQAAGSYKLVVRCTVCNEIQSSEDKTIDQLAHEYDAETGICKNGCSALAGAAVIQGEKTTYYTNAIDALAAASGTGATVHIMKTVTVSMISKFNSYEKALKNVTITTAEGVSLKDNSGAAADHWYVNGITIGANASVFFDACPYFYGDNHIYGNADLYVARVNGKLTVHGDQGGYLKTSGNAWVSGTLKIVGDGSNTLVAKFNSGGSAYDLFGTGGKLIVENAKISCGIFNWYQDSAEATLTNAKVECANFNVDGGSSVTLVGTTNITVAAGGATTVANGTITMAAGSTITTASADLQTVKIVAAEGVNGCVWYENGAYIVKNHVAANATCTEDGKCSNCDAVVNKAPGHSLTKTEAKDDTCTAAGNSEYWTCTTCGKFFSDAEGKIEINENDWVIDEIKAHAWGSWTDAGDGKHSRVCANDVTHVEAVAHNMNEWAAGVRGCKDCSYSETCEHKNKTSTVKTPNSCTEKGVMSYNCPDCGHSWDEDIAAAGHTLTQVAEKKATCVEVGHKAYEYCTKCVYTTYEETPVDSKNHTNLQNQDAQAPTCDSVGWNAYEHCSACGYSSKVTIDPKGHTYIYTELAEGGHKVTCEDCTYYDSYEDCVDADANKLCDDCGAKLVDPVATVGGEEYESLADAFAAAQDNDVINVLCDITITRDDCSVSGSYIDGLLYTGDKSFTVDFGGFTVTDDGCVNDYLIYLKNQGAKDNEITFTNGKLVVKDAAYAAITVGHADCVYKTVLNLNGMEITIGNPDDTNNQALRARYGGTINLNAGTVVNSKGTSYGVVADTKGVVNINDGAKVVHTDSNTTSGNQVYTAVSGLGIVNIYEGAEIISDNYGVYPMTSGTPVVNIYGGTITAPIALGAATNGGAGQKTTINVSGGTINGALYNNNNDGVIVVSGGIFDAPVAEKYCAEGYQPKDNGDGTYGVIEHTCSYTEQYFEATFEADAYTVYTCTCGDTYTVTHEGTKKTAVATVNDEKFETLQAAFDAAQDGDVVEILCDITITAKTAGYTDVNGGYIDGVRYTGDKSFTVDFNGFTVTDDGSINDYLLYVNNKGTKANEITFMNGTVTVNDAAWSAIAVNSDAATANCVLNLNGMTVNMGNPDGLANNVVRVRKNGTLNLNADTVINSDGTSYGATALTGGILNVNNGAKIVHTNSKSTNGNMVYTAVSGLGIVNIYEGAEIISDNYGVYPMTSGTPVVNIYGGTITAPIALGAATNGGAGQKTTINVSGGTITGALYNNNNDGVIVVSGGIFDAPVAEKYCAEGYQPKDNGDGTYGVIEHTCSYTEQYFEATFDADAYTVYTCTCGDTYTVTHEGTKKTAVATVNGEKFETLAEAVAAAVNGETVILVSDIVLDNRINVGYDEKLVLDLNGYVIDAIGKQRIAIMSYGDLTIKDTSAAQTGMIKAGTYADNGKHGGNTINVCAGSFTLESGTIYSLNNALLVDEEVATIVINGGKLHAETTTDNSAAMYLSAPEQTDVTINGGELVGYNGILLWNNTTINMVGGSIDAQGDLGIQGNGSRDNTEINISGDASVSGVMAGIYHPQGGKLTISGNANISGGTGIVVKGGNVTISGGMISGNGQVGAYAPNGNGFNPTGDALYVEHFDNSTSSSNYGTPVVTVTGGTFTSANGKAIGNYANTGMEPLAGFVTGGNFSESVAKELCAPGYKSKDNGDGTHTVVVNDQVVAYNVQTGEEYKTVQEALDAAEKGETVKLLKDAEAEELFVGSGKTLDLNGKKLTVNVAISASFKATHIIDSTNGSATLVLVDDADYAFNPANAQLVIWTTEGLKFVDVNFDRALGMYEGNPDKAYFRFAFDEAQVLLDQILANGSEGTGLTIRIKVDYVTASGMQAHQYYEYTSDLVEDYYNDYADWRNAMFKLVLSGVENLSDMVFTAEIVSTAGNGTQVVVGSEPIYW